MWQEKGEDMAFAIAFGVPPVCAWQSASRVPDYVDEYDIASQMLNAPIEMVKCETNDLMVPATAEIVIEGFVSISETLVEGPYGEHAGYHFDDKVVPKPRQDITCVTFRNNAILPIGRFHRGNPNPSHPLPAIRLLLFVGSPAPSATPPASCAISRSRPNRERSSLHRRIRFGASIARPGSRWPSCVWARRLRR